MHLAWGELIIEPMHLEGRNPLRPRIRNNRGIDSRRRQKIGALQSPQIQRFIADRSRRPEASMGRLLTVTRLS